MHKGPQVSPAGLCVCTDRTDAGNVCKIWSKLKPSPRGEGDPKGWMRGACTAIARKWVAAGGLPLLSPLRGQLQSPR